MDWGGLVGSFGPLAMCVLFVVLGLLSRRLGRVTRMPRYYLSFYLAAVLVGISALARLVNLGLGGLATAELHQRGMWVVIYSGLPALGITIALMAAWRYWSWLLAERS
jgi:hypothetical protein